MRENVTSDNLIIPLDYGGATPERSIATNAGQVKPRIEKWS